MMSIEILIGTIIAIYVIAVAIKRYMEITNTLKGPYQNDVVSICKENEHPLDLPSPSKSGFPDGE